MPTFFMRTHGQSSGFGDSFTSDMDTAMLDVTPDLIELCRRRSQQILKLAAADESLWELYFWDPGRVSWWEHCPSDLIESMGLLGAEDAADNGELVELTDASALKSAEPCAVECDQMRVLVERQASGPSVCEFGWGDYRKHGDVWVRTPTFTIAHFEQALTKAAVAASQLERNDL